MSIADSIEALSQDPAFKHQVEIFSHTWQQKTHTGFKEQGILVIQLFFPAPECAAFPNLYTS